MKSVHAKAPLRLGLAGGGTDVSPYSDTFGGLVLNATISLSTHVHITLLNSADIVFSAIDFGVEECLPLENHFPLDGALVLHRAVYNRIVRDFNKNEPLSIKVVSYSDAPPGSGVGSSSALVVALIHAYQELLQLPLGEYDIARLAYEIERIDCGMSGGKQDQYAAAFGGVNFMEFSQENKVVVNPLRIKPEVLCELESQLLLYFTGRSRESASIIDSQIQATKNSDSDALAAMHQMKHASIEMKEYLLKGNIRKVLDILGESWHAKKRAASAITNSHIEEIATSAYRAGAHALKISGAGGGGFMMIGAHPGSRYQVIRALEPFGGQFFSFQFVNEGVKSWISN